MLIDVRLLFHLRKYAGHDSGRTSLELPEGATIDHLKKVLAIPDTQKTTVLVNGRRAVEGRVLENNDQITFFPPVDGG